MTEQETPKLILKPSHIHGYTEERLQFYHALLDLFSGNTRAARAVADHTDNMADAQTKGLAFWLRLKGVGPQSAEAIMVGLAQKPVAAVPSRVRIVYIDEDGQEHLTEADAIAANLTKARERDEEVIHDFLEEGMEGYDANLSVMVKALFDNADQVVGILSRYIQAQG